jgi:AraC-like DNA-binding protein
MGSCNRGKDNSMTLERRTLNVPPRRGARGQHTQLNREPASQVRNDWLSRVVTRTQSLVGAITFDRTITPPQLEEFLCDPTLKARTTAERLLLRGIVLEAALNVVAYDPAGLPTAILEILERLHIESSSSDSDTRRVLRHCCTTAAVSSVQSADYLTAEAARTFIESHFTERLTTKSIARHTNTTSDELHRTFTKHVGTTPSDYIRYVRIKEAFRLLHETDTKVESVASMIGLRSKRHLYRLLQTVTPLKPRELRSIPFHTCLRMLKISRWTCIKTRKL